MSLLEFKGPLIFRSRVVCSTLSGRAIRIVSIRKDDEEPGLKPFEVLFLKLVEQLTNGGKVDINVTGTSVLYKPGILEEGILPLLLFLKRPVEISFIGITNSDVDVSVDVLRTVTIPFLTHFGVESGWELRIKKRGCQPGGGGLVILKSTSVINALKVIDLVDDGMFKRIRGVAYTSRVSGTMAHRCIDSCRGLLNKFIPDVYVFVDQYGGVEAGASPGYGLSLVAESTTGIKLAAEGCGIENATPEDLGLAVAKILLGEIYQGGCVDSMHQSLALLLMAYNVEERSRIRVGPLTQQTMDFLAFLKEICGAVFDIEVDEKNSQSYILSTLGIGFSNVNKPYS